MAVHQPAHPRTSRPWRKHRTQSAQESAESAVVTTAAERTFAVVRVAVGAVFLWAFVDKLFGWGYATPAGKGWIDGGSPTKGFLSGVAAGPLESTFHSWAGAAWADWLFMLGLLGIGAALVAGVALRLTAVAGSLMMVLMWAAEWPPATQLSDGSPSMSTNPVLDYHLVYALVLIALAVARADRPWGLGRVWERLPFVARNRWLL
ncbi:thiosulfate dehydrogenase [quinone] large subunit [Streptomyces sp. Amel2xB2]|uniref:DoxX family membrane protein n=1 Tax=Streptomyces sp. Amel2xB2 TaxID=1305829 RepID=UPI000DBA8684|nr:DoxX family membrane protein [Streptomyces sp. Amel2xB2]RAJ71582.1 thiosulfate dehydrogenase [quinone] large subunit [Streptomyces sp. Amel2xB2]